MPLRTKVACPIRLPVLLCLWCYDKYGWHSPLRVCGGDVYCSGLWNSPWFGDQVLLVVTALLASIGAAGIPMAGLVMITVILTALHLPMEGVGLILAVDRILDMYRTSVNVWSDSCGAVIIAKSEEEKLNV